MCLFLQRCPRKFEINYELTFWVNLVFWHPALTALHHQLLHYLWPKSAGCIGPLKISVSLLVSWSTTGVTLTWIHRPKASMQPATAGCALLPGLIKIFQHENQIPLSRCILTKLLLLASSWGNQIHKTPTSNASTATYNKIYHVGKATNLYKPGIDLRPERKLSANCSEYKPTIWHCRTQGGVRGWTHSKSPPPH